MMELNNNAGLFDTRPPSLEDAGLEDCALPAHAIQEACRRAADAVQSAQRQVHSAATGILGSIGVRDQDFSKDPGPSNGMWEDSCVDPKGLAGLGEEQSCVDTKAGGLIEEGHDRVGLHIFGDGNGDKLELGEGEGPKLGDDSCVEGLPGDRGQSQRPPSDDTDEGPILVLA